MQKTNYHLKEHKLTSEKIANDYDTKRAKSIKFSCQDLNFYEK